MTTQQQPNSSSSTALPLLYFPPFYAWEILVTLFYDVTIVCSIILAGKPLHMHRWTADSRLHTCRHPCQLTILTEITKCRRFVSEPIFVPVTYIYIYIYIYHDRRLNEQFINDRNYKAMTVEIIKEVTTIKRSKGRYKQTSVVMGKVVRCSKMSK